jgi:hypothetical protein
MPVIEMPMTPVVTPNRFFSESAISSEIAASEWIAVTPFCG